MLVLVKKEYLDVVLPFHRKDIYLQRSLHSLASSKDVNIRLILVDDRKSKNCEVDTSAFLNKVVIETGGIGYSKAVRAGLHAVDSEFFAFMDSDDLTDPERLVEQLHVLQNGYDVCVTGMLKVNWNGLPFAVQPPRFTDVSLFKLMSLLGSINSNSTWACRTGLLEEDWFFNDTYDAIDWATGLQLSQDTRIFILRKRLYKYRVHPLQLTKSPIHLTRSIHQIYPIWKKLNYSHGLPDIEPLSMIALTLPGLFKGLGENSPFPTDWVYEFLRLPNLLNSSDLSSAKLVLLKKLFQSGGLVGGTKLLAEVDWLRSR